MLVLEHLAQPSKMNRFQEIFSLCTACKTLKTLAVFLPLFLSTTFSADSTGQKAHFQVEDKSGDLKISATKDLAKVTAQADSVQVVVKPGTADYPVLKSDKPIVHITQPGWHTISFKKSVIFKTTNGKTRGNWKKRIANSKSLHRLKLRNRRRKMFKKNGSSLLRLKTKKKIFSGSHQEDITGNKKSEVKYSGFHVTGNAGKLKMHVTKDETTLSSESGGVDISLNKPSSPSSSSSSSSNQRSFKAQSQQFTGETSNKTIHFASEIENNMSYIGLRKSVVTRLHDQEPDWD